MNHTKQVNRRAYLYNHLLKENTDQVDPFQGKLLRIPLEIAGIRVDIVTWSATVQEDCFAHFHDYLSNESPCIAEIAVEPFAVAGFSGLWEDSDQEFYFYGEHLSEYVVQRDFAAKRLPPKRSGEQDEQIFRASALINPTELRDAIHYLLRWFMPDLLLDASALLLHGAGIVKNNQGHVFFGQRDFGKSLCTDLAADAASDVTILGDDSVIIQYKNNQLWLHSAPLGGSFWAAPPKLRVPLASLRAVSELDSPLSTTEIMASLLASTATAKPEHEAQIKLVELVGRIANSTPEAQWLSHTQSRQPLLQVGVGLARMSG